MRFVDGDPDEIARKAGLARTFGQQLEHASSQLVAAQQAINAAGGNPATTAVRARLQKEITSAAGVVRTLESVAKIMGDLSNAIRDRESSAQTWFANLGYPQEGTPARTAFEIELDIIKGQAFYDRASAAANLEAISLGYAVDEIRQEVADLPDTLTSWLKETYADINKKVDEALGAVQNAFGSSLQWLDSEASDLGKWIDTTFNDARNWIHDNVSGFLHVVGDTLTVVGTTLIVAGLAIDAIGAVIAPETLGTSLFLEIPGTAIAAFGGMLLGAGSMANSTADWADRKIDGKGLVEQGLLNGALTLATMGVAKLAEMGIARYLASNPQLSERITELLKKLQKDDSAATGSLSHGTREHPLSVNDLKNIESDTATKLPRNAFVKSENGILYETDAQGRVTHVSGELSLGDGKSYSDATRQQVRGQGLPTDDTGHIIAKRFEGDNSLINLVPQDSNLNRGRWNSMESSWASEIDNGSTIDVQISLTYPESSSRPSDFVVKWTSTSPTGNVTVESRTFSNE